MKFCLIFLLICTDFCKAQQFQAEFMAGVAGYNGDLTQKRISFGQLREAVNVNLKYNSGNFFNFRIGFAYGRIMGDDKNNAEAGLRKRNLSFKSDILEVSFVGEVNLFDPAVYTSYPYFLGGIGAFHFNPFTLDNDNKKTYLEPLSTEGEGLKEYPDRKKYSLIQLCIPVGVGWKWVISENLDVSYELGARILFTDYLDDVSKTYVNLNVLAVEKGPTAVELSYRQNTPVETQGGKRGNPSKKDLYYFTGIKFSIFLAGRR